MTKVTVATEKYLAASMPRAQFYQEASRPPTQRKFDVRRWQSFSDYLGSKDPWNATDEDVAAWCASLSNKGLTHATIQGYLASLSYTFSIAGKGSLHGKPGTGIRKDNPAASHLARSTLRGVRLVQNRPIKRKAPLFLSALDDLIDLQADNLLGIRNRAIYAITWSCALDQKEVLSLDLKADGNGTGYIKIEKNGFVVRLHRWCGPRLGRVWSVVCVPLRSGDPERCATKYLREWLQVYRKKQGPLFPKIKDGEILFDQRMSPFSMNRFIKIDVENIGLPPEEYSFRSLRRGCLEWMAKEGAPLDQIIRHSRIRTVERVTPYIRPYRALADSPLRLTKWIHDRKSPSQN